MFGHNVWFLKPKTWKQEVIILGCIFLHQLLNPRSSHISNGVTHHKGSHTAFHLIIHTGIWLQQWLMDVDSLTNISIEKCQLFFTFCLLFTCRRVISTSEMQKLHSLHYTCHRWCSITMNHHQQSTSTCHFVFMSLLLFCKCYTIAIPQ